MEHQRKDANIIFASLFIQTAGCEQTEYWKNKIHIEDVWKETYGNENIIVGIIDSGIDITSSDLQSVIYHNDQEISNNQVDDVVNAIKYGYNKGIRLFNCSWDMEVYSEKLYTIMKECSDAIFVCSGGKNSSNVDVQHVYPACFELPNAISILMNVINVAGNALFVFVFKWSVAGVALSTALSRVAAGIVMTVLVCGKTNPIRIDHIKYFVPDWIYIKKILTIGIPSGIENGMFQIGKLMVVSMVATFGTASTAANSVGYTVIDFANIPASSMGLALITVVGQCIGAGEKEQAKMYTKKVLKYAYFGDWICNIPLFFLAPFIASWFNLSGEATQITVMILRCFNVRIAVEAYQFVP